MNLNQHPEYEKYQSDKAIMRSVQAELTQWFEADEEAEETLKTAVPQLTALFQNYNQVMWQAFPFCQMCLGGCCVVGASEVTTIDAAALSIMGCDLPVLPDQTHHDERACVYLGQQGCTWPANWRPLKCMTFYSLGSGDWQLESSDERYDRLTQALQAVLEEHLPTILDETSNIDIAELAEPIGFAAALSQQLAKQFLPKNSSFILHPSSFQTNPTTTALLAIAEITEQILNNPPDMADQFLTDLEQFEWIVTGRPAQETELLAEINGRYSPHVHKHPSYQQFTQNIQQYQQSINKNLEDS